MTGQLDTALVSTGPLSPAWTTPHFENLELLALRFNGCLPLRLPCRAVPPRTIRPTQQLYDTAREPPRTCDGGVLLAVNGLRALQALDPQLYGRWVEAGGRGAGDVGFRHFQNAAL